MGTKHTKTAALVAALALLLSGCATLFSTPTQDVTFTSEPAGAKVYLDGELLGETPVQVVLARWDDGVVRFEKEGYEAAVVHLDKTLNPVAILDLPWFIAGVIPGVIAVGVDLGTGSFFSFSPAAYAATLGEDHSKVAAVDDGNPMGMAPPYADEAIAHAHHPHRWVYYGDPHVYYCRVHHRTYCYDGGTWVVRDPYDLDPAWRGVVLEYHGHEPWLHGHVHVTP